jgi:hypothetical protein
VVRSECLWDVGIESIHGGQSSERSLGEELLERDPFQAMAYVSPTLLLPRLSLTLVETFK